MAAQLGRRRIVRPLPRADGVAVHAVGDTFRSARDTNATLRG